MSISFAHSYLSDMPLTLTNTSFSVGPCLKLEGVGVLHNILLYFKQNEVPLDFHVFDIKDFDVIIGHPLEKLFAELPESLPESRDLELKLGRETYSFPITQAKNSMIDSLPNLTLPMEVMAISPFELPKSSLE